MINNFITNLGASYIRRLMVFYVPADSSLLHKTVYKAVHLNLITHLYFVYFCHEILLFYQAFNQKSILNFLGLDG